MFKVYQRYDWRTGNKMYQGELKTVYAVDRTTEEFLIDDFGKFVWIPMEYCQPV